MHIHPQEATDLLSRILQHLGGDVKGEACGIMPEEARQGLHIHAILEGWCSEGMPQIMEGLLLQLFFLSDLTAGDNSTGIQAVFRKSTAK